jgi:HTH-type transcriptional regulator/antitoxin HigA
MTDRLTNEYRPDVVTPPGETLQEAIEALGMTKAELAARIGKTPKTVGEIIKHGAPVTPSTAMELEKVLGIPSSFWNNRERRYRESLARQEERKRLEKRVGWLKSFPVREMVKAGWIKAHKDKAVQLKELLRYFGVASPEQWKKIWLSPETAYRKSKAFAGKPEASSVWLRNGELQARQIKTRPFNKEAFRSLLQDIRALTQTAPERFQEEVVNLCAEVGVAVVFTPPIKGAPVYGATRWLTPDKALIQLSLRGKFEDLLWFTFFNEAGHILLHGKKEIFIEEKDSQDEREQKADRFARDLLIPPAAYRRFINSGRYRDSGAVKEFAAQLGISPAIVVGRLQYEKLLHYSRMNDLRRRFDFVDTNN